MSPETSGPVELHDARSPADDGWPGDGADEPDPGWPDDAEDERDPDWPDDWPDHGGDGPPWRRAAPPAASGRDGRPGGPGGPALRPLALAIVAVLALGAGAGVALVITRGLDGSSSPSAAPGIQPSAVAPGGSNGTIPGGSGGGTNPGGGGPVEQMFVTGRVSAVSAASVTIGGPGHSVTAAITSSTRITGSAASIGAVRVGDEVSAQITQSNGGQLTVTAIQDPAQAQSAGGLP